MSPIAPIPSVPEPPRLSRAVGLGRLAENSLVRFFVQVFNLAKDALAELLRNAIERLLESVEKPLAEMAGPVLGDVLESPALPPSVRSMLTRVKDARDQAGIIGLAVAAGTVISMLVPAMLSGVRDKVQQVSFFVTRPYLLDFHTWLVASRRNPTLKFEMENDLRGQGWREDQISAARLASETRLGVNEILAAFVRGEISDGIARVRLQQHGVAAEDIAVLLKLTEQIPGPGDLVRFALREAWRDDVAARYGYDQGMVAEFTSWMQKQGYDPEWSRAYWRSHWMVPSVGQGFEMMHRGIISDAELVELLTVNDIAPGWIPNLVAMARPVPGRVDRRWAFDENEINETQLFDLFKADGYDDFWAGVMTNTVVKRSVSESKGLTRAAIVAAYRKRRLTFNESVSMLDDIGIQEAVAQFFLGQADSDRADDLLERRIAVVKKQFSAGDLTAAEAAGALRQLGVGSAEIDVYIEEWSIARTSKVKRPSRSNLDSFFRDGVINVASYRDQMDRLGYSDVYIDWYLASLSIERQEIAEKDERAARIESERVGKDKKKTNYQMSKARVDVDIAELNAAIASAQVALVEAQNERDQQLTHALPAAAIAALEREYQPLLFDAEAAIAEAQLRIARLQTTIKESRASIALVNRSLIENVDMTKYAALKAERLTAQTSQARLGESIAADTVAIAQLKEAIPAFTDESEIAAAKQQLLALQTAIAQSKEQQAILLTQIKELDEEMSRSLSAVRRSELLSEKSTLGVDIAGIETEIASVRETIRAVQFDRETLESELAAQVTALPGSEAQIAIRSEFLTRTGQIESNIKEYRENVALLRLEKSRLAVEWRM